MLDASYKHALQSAPIPPSLAGYSSRKQADAVFLSKELDKISRAGVEGPFTVSARGKEFPVERVDLPFVPHRSRD